jgi:rhodanese-related sulfurtransferase
VRGARIVLADNDGVRANMSASWLAQMGWDVYVVDDTHSSNFSEKGQTLRPLPPLPEVHKITPHTLANWVNSTEQTIVLDVATSQHYIRQHVPGAWYVLRSNLAKDWHNVPKASRYVVTSENGLLALFAIAEIKSLASGAEVVAVVALDGGTQAWCDAGFPIEYGPTHFASEPIDRYRRPYEGTDNPREAMQGYLDWEFGLVEQLSKDGTHHFKVI